MKVILLALLNLSVAGFNVTAPVSVQDTSGASIPSIRFCDLVSNPSRYDNRVIRITAILVENQTPRVDGADPFLYNPSCKISDFTVVVSSSDSFNENDPANKALKRIRNKPDKRGNTRAAVTVIGQFNASGKRKYGHLDWADSEFVIQRIEKAMPIVASTPWPRRFRQ